ncbi:MAG: hypothetical protein EBS64_06250 [Verrucomicrobia bacterium]|nr:hypothetical protein [Verrucomicrobiota bacterium]
MKIAVLGCGYVGAQFARLAKAHGHEILGVVRSDASRDRLRRGRLCGEHGRRRTGGLCPRL